VVSGTEMGKFWRLLTTIPISVPPAENDSLSAYF
jgi:hypothetical protein